MKPLVTLVCFATGDVYKRYADGVRETAAEFFFPGRSQYLQLETTPSWPHASRDRWGLMVRHRRQIRGDYVFLIDADSRFEGVIDEGVLCDGITATIHPAFPAGMHHDQFTYERNPESAAYIPYGQGERYYPGHFTGAPRDVFFGLAAKVQAMCEQDDPFVPVWYEESYLNRIFLDDPPELLLDERYCVWFHKHVHDGRLRALNKTPEEYSWRDNQNGKEQAA